MLQASLREEVGRGVASLRRRGLLPAVLYGKNLKALNLTLSERDFEHLFKQAGRSTILGLRVNGGLHAVLIKDVALDPRSERPLHVDFYQVKMDEKIRTAVPLHLEGVAPAVRNLGGILVVNKNEVEVECLPKDLPHAIVADLNQLETLEAALHVRDLIAPGRVKILDPGEEVVAVVTAPAVEEEAKPALSEAEAIQAVEVTEKKEEGEAAEATDEDK